MCFVIAPELPGPGEVVGGEPVKPSSETPYQQDAELHAGSPLVAMEEDAEMDEEGVERIAYCDKPVVGMGGYCGAGGVA